MSEPVDVSITPGAEMSTLERRRMSYEDYLALPESLRAEWVDGEVVVTPSPSYRHQRTSLRLTNRIGEALPTLFVVGRPRSTCRATGSGSPTSSWSTASPTPPAVDLDLADLLGG